MPIEFACACGQKLRFKDASAPLPEHCPACGRKWRAAQPAAGLPIAMPVAAGARRLPTALPVGAAAMAAPPSAGTVNQEPSARRFAELVVNSVAREVRLVAAYFWRSRCAFWHRVVGYLPLRNNRQIQLSAYDNYPNVEYDKGRWQIELPAVCVACGSAADCTESTEVRAAPDVTRPIWAMATSLAVGAAFAVYFGSRWPALLAAIAGLDVGYRLRRQSLVQLVVHRCRKHTAATELPEVYASANSLWLCGIHPDLIRELTQRPVSSAPAPEPTSAPAASPTAQAGPPLALPVAEAPAQARPAPAVPSTKKSQPNTYGGLPIVTDVGRFLKMLDKDRKCILLIRIKDHDKVARKLAEHYAMEMVVEFQADRIMYHARRVADPSKKLPLLDYAALADVGEIHRRALESFVPPPLICRDCEKQFQPTERQCPFCGGEYAYSTYTSISSDDEEGESPVDIRSTQTEQPKARTGSAMAKAEGPSRIGCLFFWFAVAALIFVLWKPLNISDRLSDWTAQAKELLVKHGWLESK